MGELTPVNKLAEGKTKAIWSTQNPDLVIVESGNAITAGDGVRRDVMPDKAYYSTETTVNCFRLLQRHGIRTSFVDRYSDTAFVAHRGIMVPVESVARRIATGSYLLRNPDVPEGTRFDPLVTEMFYKDDPRHDPMIEKVGEQWHLYQARLPKSEGFMEAMPASWLPLTMEQIALMRDTTSRVFSVLEQSWAKQNVALLDIKIEFDDQMRVSDVIDNDSWRIKLGGVTGETLDKQNFRDGTKDMVELAKDYSQVAKMTAAF